MSRRSYPGAKATTPQERREQAEAARTKQLEKFKQVQAQRVAEIEKAELERQSIPQRDKQQFGEALKDIPLRQVGVESTLRISQPYQQVSQIILQTMNERERQAILCWPQCDPSPSALVALLSLADCAARESIRVKEHDALAAPQGMRALIYPYARTAHRALRHLYIDKEFVGHNQLRHHIRNFNREDDESLADYHKTLSRAKSLTGIARDGNLYEELLHPCLDEIIPSGPCSGENGRSGLLWRIGKHTDIKELGRTERADDHKEAWFYLFGLRAAENPEAAIKRFSGGLDLVLLDMDYTGRNRLGDEWIKKTRELITLLKEKFGELPVIALTDDPWAYDALRFDVLGTKAGKKKRPCDSSVVFFPRSDIAVLSDQPEPEYSVVSECEVLGFSGAVESLLIGIRAALKKSYRINDRNTADLLRTLSARIRRCISLPGPLSQLSEFYAREHGSDLAAAEMLSGYRIEPITRELRESNAAFAQLNRPELNDICAEAEKVAVNVTKLTPMSLLLLDVIAQYLRKSSRTIVIAPDDVVADFALHALEEDESLGEAVTDKVFKQMLVVSDRSGLAELDTLPASKKNEFKRAIIFAPSRSSLLSILAREWLPEKIIVLADCDTLRSASQDTARLAGISELGALEERMRLFTEQASRKVEEITRTTVSFNGTEEPGDDLAFPRGGTVNLAANARAGQTVLHFEFADGQTLIARHKTKLVTQDRTRAIPSFTEIDAQDVGKGDFVCVIGDAFLEMARPLLNITVRAAEEIRVYHELVLEKFAEQPGDSENEKLQFLVENMALSNVSVQRAKYWIDLEDQLDAPLHEVVPHAPRDWPTFQTFMKALGVGERTAIRYWTWAVIAQRASRHRAALSFHEAYRGILVEGYAAQSDNPQHVNEVRKLRAAAENFVGIVRTKTEEKIATC